MQVQPRKPRRLVIGLGNPLSGDDGFGPRVIQRLQEKEPASLAGVDIVDAHTDLLVLLDRLPDFDRIVIVDALLDADCKLGKPGDLVVLEERDLDCLPSLSHNAHQLSPLVAIQLFRRLHPMAKSHISLLVFCTDCISMELGMGPRTGHLTDGVVDAGIEILCRLMTN